MSGFLVVGYFEINRWAIGTGVHIQIGIEPLDRQVVSAVEIDS